MTRCWTSVATIAKCFFFISSGSIIHHYLLVIDALISKASTNEKRRKFYYIKLNFNYENPHFLVSFSFFLSLSHLLTRYWTSWSWRERRTWPSSVSSSPTLSTWSEVDIVLSNFLVYLLYKTRQDFLNLR